MAERVVSAPFARQITEIQNERGNPKGLVAVRNRLLAADGIHYAGETGVFSEPEAGEGLMHTATIFAAPQEPITTSEGLTAFANNLLPEDFEADILPPDDIMRRFVRVDSSVGKVNRRTTTRIKPIVRAVLLDGGVKVGKTTGKTEHSLDQRITIDVVSRAQEANILFELASKNL
jgi:hypothetical protein